MGTKTYYEWCGKVGEFARALVSSPLSVFLMRLSALSRMFTVEGDTEVT